VLSPIYWLLAYRDKTPGLNLRKNFASLAFRLLIKNGGYVSFGDIYRLFCNPMDSTRYFEFAFVCEALSKASMSRYLDVSSPRLLPIFLTFETKGLHSELVNPDLSDLRGSAGLIQALRLESRCTVHGCLIDDVPFDSGSFDVVSSISVVEHIPDDTKAVQKMWNLLKPGGRLLLTLPCAVEASNRFINRNEYGLLAPNDDGYFFFHRLYDQRLLEDNIFSVTGRPLHTAIYGEKRSGFLRENLDRKMADPLYPYWREPYMMGTSFCYFDELSELPGEGVIGLEFQKSE
jgi:hypothetical protein